MTKRKKKTQGFWWYVWVVVVFVVKLPYYFVRWVWWIGKKVEKSSEDAKVYRKRRDMGAKFEDFEVLKVVSGNYNSWMLQVSRSDSQIGIILGARGSGKTAFGIKFLENFYAKYKKKCFAIGFKESELPSWIDVISDVGGIENGSLVLIDEGGVLFSSRSSMSNANKMLSELIMIARHKNISILFISQNSSNLEVNVLRQADFLVLKPSSLLQKDFERKTIQKIYGDLEDGFKKFADEKGIGYIYSGKFRGFVVNPLPSFWKEGISKGFAKS